MEIKEIEIFAELCGEWSAGTYLGSFKRFVTFLENNGFKVKYEIEKTFGGRQEVYLVKGGEKILVYSKMKTDKYLNEGNSKGVLEKIKELLAK